MGRITATQIRRIMPNAKSDRVAAFVESFNEWAGRFGIDTPLRTAHYIAQVAHETGELRYMEEISSGRQYEGRLDLGNTRPGDGARFKGRGYLQTTGRNNYLAYSQSEYCVGDLMAHPEWLAREPGAQKSSMFYWQRRGLNRWADADDCEGVTRRINGGLNGLSQRKYYLRMAKRVFGL